MKKYKNNLDEVYLLILDEMCNQVENVIVLYIILKWWSDSNRTSEAPLVYYRNGNPKIIIQNQILSVHNHAILVYAKPLNFFFSPCKI